MSRIRVNEGQHGVIVVRVNRHRSQINKIKPLTFAG